MQMMLNVVEKTSQLAELKKSITQNDLHHFTDDKHLSDHTLSAAAEKTRNVLLKNSELISEKIEKMNIV